MCKEIEGLFIKVEHSREWFDRNRSRILKLFVNKKCTNCNSSKDMHIHHIVPLSKGGFNKLSNFVLLCSDCHSKVHGNKGLKNIAKGAKLSREERHKKRRIEVVSKTLELLEKNSEGRIKKSDVAELVGITSYQLNKKWYNDEEVLGDLSSCGVNVRFKWITWKNPYDHVKTTKKETVYFCMVCNATYIKRSNRQKYCSACSKKVERDRGRKRVRRYRNKSNEIGNRSTEETNEKEVAI